ncbi:MAG: GntR family transcriptional regulator [Rubrivivax sp.]|jgi:GntR family transcriptional regulator
MTAPSVVETPSFSPLYQQIRTLLVKGLEQGEWRPGQAIPSELELAARFKVSQGTVRKAIDEMVVSGLLVRRQGKGTFVATHAEEATQYRFLRLTADDGDAQPLKRRLIECRRMRAPAEVARALDLRSGDTVVHLRRLLIATEAVAGQMAEVPVVLDDIWLPAALFKGLTLDSLQAWRGPLYRMFEAEFQLKMVRADEKLRAVAAGADDAALLEVAAGAPLLQVERLASSYGGRPVEWRLGLYRTDRHHYRNTLT